jgi:hypothetical protein
MCTPSSMKLPARSEVEVVGRQAEAPVADEPQIAGLDLEHVEVVDEPVARVEPAARLGHPFHHPGEGEVVIAECAPLDVADHQGRVLGQVLDDGCADTGHRRDHGVPVFVVPVDGECARPGARDAHDVGLVAHAHLEVPVGEPTGELLDLHRAATQHGDPVAQPVGQHRGTGCGHVVCHV